jgi:hypothetical protein
MSGSYEEDELELAELLREVRAIRALIDELAAFRVVQPALAPGYEVAVRSPVAIEADYAVLVRPPIVFEQPSYEVAVRAAGEEPVVE